MKLNHLTTFLYANITRTKRYIPKFEWNDSSISYNLFRTYEFFFGRKVGIRAESFTRIEKNGESYHEFYTVESIIVYFEFLVRKFFAGTLPKLEFKEVYLLPQYIGNGAHYKNPARIPIISFAIATDAYTDIGQSNSTTSLSGNHTVAGSDTFLTSGVVGAVTTDNISGQTYNSISNTQLDKDHMYNDADRWAYSFYKFGPSTGTNSLVTTSASSEFVAVVVGSYSGVSSTFDTTLTTKSDASELATFDNTITSTADSCWHVATTAAASGIGDAGTGTTRRVRQATQSNLMILDNNTAISPPASNTLQMTLNLGIRAGPVMFGMMLKPAGAGGATATYSPQLLTLRVG